MKRLVARTAVAAAVLATSTVTAPPAHAVTALTIEGTLEIGCFGCGSYGPEGNGGSFTAIGLLGPEIVTGASGSMTFTVDMPTGAGCLVSWAMEGWLHLDTALQDVYSRFTVLGAGTAGYLYVHGVGWSGAIGMKITEPVGFPCGGAVTATFAGELAALS